MKHWVESIKTYYIYNIFLHSIASGPPLSKLQNFGEVYIIQTLNLLPTGLVFRVVSRWEIIFSWKYLTLDFRGFVYTRQIWPPKPRHGLNIGICRLR